MSTPKRNVTRVSRKDRMVEHTRRRYLLRDKKKQKKNKKKKKKKKTAGCMHIRKQNIGWGLKKRVTKAYESKMWHVS